jgi:hypothetical protein
MYIEKQNFYDQRAFNVIVVKVVSNLDKQYFIEDFFMFGWADFLQQLTPSVPVYWAY